MELIKHKTNIDFIGKRRPALFVSTILNLGIIVGVAIWGFNYGVDFAGGTVVEMKFPYSISDHDVRKAAEVGGLHDPTVQGIGSANENAFFLRMGGVTQLTAETAAAAQKSIEGIGATEVRRDLDNGIL